ncbi:MAG: sugar transferase, partial [Nitrososphaera sp.]|nr:sugar transferase [Nitrososphaera sp.]
MSVLVARLLSLRQEIAIEIQKFVLLWRYQHPVTPFRLWWRLILKRCVDFIAAVIGLIILSPVLALIGLIIKLDSKGPAVYVQERAGHFGERFHIYKFRTMVVDAEASG